MATWDPDSYLRFDTERSRPLAELIDRVGATDPRAVVDLGCGPGALTATLAGRWPHASIVGIDSSPEMIEAAGRHAGPCVRFEAGDVATWVPTGSVDVIVSNATLQWVPGHRDRFAAWVDALVPGGWFAFQVPGNFEEPSQRLLADLAADSRFAAATAGVERPAAEDARRTSPISVGSAVRSTPGRRPTSTSWLVPTRCSRGSPAREPGRCCRRCRPEQREVFEAEYAALLRTAYPPQPFGTVLPFRRVFVVARKPVAA